MRFNALKVFRNLCLRTLTANAQRANQRRNGSRTRILDARLGLRDANCLTDRLKWTVFGGTTTMGLSFTFWSAKEEQSGDHKDPFVDAQADTQIPETENKEEPSGWNGLDILKHSLSVQAISSAMATWTWPTTFDFSAVQERISSLILELGMGPGSLYSEIVNDPPDPDIYPEIEWDAEVRLGEDVCLSERAFLRERKRRMRKHFAQLFSVHEKDIDERDLPIVALAGSGGGYRAMLNTIGSLIGAESCGLFPCLTYTAGVSGSCWALSVLYTGVAGSHRAQDAAKHIVDRIKTSYLDVETLDEMVTPPTNKYLLSGILRKASGPASMASLVDVYGTLLASRIYVPSQTENLDHRHLSLHWIRRGVDSGELPLPIFTAIHQAATAENVKSLRNIKEAKQMSVDVNEEHALSEEQTKLERTVRCLWYEFTPFEVGCDETGAWIPSWALGRQFRNGKNTERRPELGLTILSGIFGSAFCASLKLYFKEIQPTLKLLPPQLYGWLEEIVTENEKDLGLIHPVLPDQVPNFLKGLDGQLREGSPGDITQQDFMSFMDAGAELNIPYYPLLRRNVDCIIALDASADSQDLWFTRAEELAAKRGLSTWPKGTKWPVQVQSKVDSLESQTASSLSNDSPGQDTTTDETNLKLAKTQESELAGQADREEHAESRGIPKNTVEPSDESRRTSPPLSSCEVWIGSSNSTEIGSSRLDDLDEDALLQRDGIGVVYIPLAANEKEMPGFDPFSISTWRREVSTEESQALLDVAEANFLESKEKIIRLLRAIWLRKKREREDREWRHQLGKLHANLRKNLL